jgi:purine-cytosine permease-like protein
MTSEPTLIAPGRGRRAFTLAARAVGIVLVVYFIAHRYEAFLDIARLVMAAIVVYYAVRIAFVFRVRHANRRAADRRHDDRRDS